MDEMSVLVLHFYVRGGEELESRLAATDAEVQRPLQADGRSPVTGRKRQHVPPYGLAVSSACKAFGQLGNVLGLPFQSIYIRFQKTVAFFSYRHSSAISNGLHNHRYIKDLYIKHKGILKISDLPFVSFRTMRFPSFASCDYGIRMRRRDDPVSHGLYARNHIMRLQTYIKKQQWTSRRIEKIFIRISATY